jgi:hypothetical protein
VDADIPGVHVGVHSCQVESENSSTGQDSGTFLVNIKANRGEPLNLRALVPLRKFRNLLEKLKKITFASVT